ncbi:MAG TPA: hypothetical protein K8V15_07720 [Tessaracoccus flavescens]|uniref:DUF4245 domain-containing protein n=1 Tax=Tessaracoccus flavescens TaxID=399497 RepID=A0A921EQE4_9ACTN|nr:hypothetical protein [Tessaracoccus flavescens]
MSEPSSQPTPEGWKPASVEPPAPAPIPTWVKATALVLAALLVALAIVVGSSLGRSSRPQPSETPTESPTPSPSFVFEAPTAVGEFVAGEKVESEGPAPANQKIARANYFDGTDRLVFAMTWPVEDLSTFLTDAGIEAAAERPGTDGVMCGKSIDTNRAACATLEDDAALLLLAVTEVPETRLAPLLAEFSTALAR